MVETEMNSQKVIPDFQYWRKLVMDRLDEITKIYEESTDDGVMTEQEPATLLFKSKLISLWLLLGRKKLDYTGQEKYFANLTNLNKHIKNPGGLTVEQAINYFLLVRDLIEILGYTKTENSSLDPTDWAGQKDGI